MEIEKFGFVFVDMFTMDIPDNFGCDERWFSQVASSWRCERSRGVLRPPRRQTGIELPVEILMSVGSQILFVSDEL